MRVVLKEIKRKKNDIGMRGLWNEKMCELEILPKLRSNYKGFSVMRLFCGGGNLTFGLAVASKKV